LIKKQKAFEEKKTEKGLLNEVVKISGLTRVETMMAVRKFVFDE